jgi:uridine kinase
VRAAAASVAAARSACLAEVAAIVCRDQLGHPTRVAVDGVTAAGKSTFARELSAAVAGLGRPSVHLTMDGFHHHREHRHRRGRLSADGYYEDAYDFAALAERVLIPLGPGGDRRYRVRVIDLDSDAEIGEAPVEAPVDAVVIVDGTFLQRPELAGLWDHRIFIDTDLAVARERGTRRDARQFGGLAQAERIYDARYHAAARRYLAEIGPAARATLVVENSDAEHPRLRVAAASGDGSLSELVEWVRSLPYGRPSGRTVAAMLAEGRGTCSTKHSYLAEQLQRRFPETEPQIVHRVYRLTADDARRLHGDRVAAAVPDEGVVDVHRYLTASIGKRRIVLDVTFPSGEPWDGRSSMPLACGAGVDHEAGSDADADKRALEVEHCDPALREPLIAALTRERVQVPEPAENHPGVDPAEAW